MVSIIIPVYNNHSMTDECIQTVMETTEDYELIVIDNGSEPPYQPPFTGFNECRVIRNDKNLGFPKAVNQGLRESKGETIILLNNDVFVTPGTLNRLDEWLNTFDIVGPTTNYAAGLQGVQIETYNSLDELNDEAEAVADSNEGECQDVNWVIGFCMAFKRSVWEQVGDFDESLWPCSGEEIDFCFRAKEKGFSIGIAFDTYVHHEGSQTFTAMENDGQLEYEKICERNDKHLAEKWGADFWFNQIIRETVRLNLGCGNYHLPGFINVDLFANVQPDLVSDALDLPYGHGTVDEIYCGHMLEHLTLGEGVKALEYWYGLLKTGGVIRVTVPDFDYLAEEHLKNPSHESMIEMNEVYIYSYCQESHHQYCYNGPLLKKVMEEAGFKNIDRLPVDHEYFVEPVPWQIGYRGEK